MNKSISTKERSKILSFFNSIRKIKEVIVNNNVVLGIILTIIGLVMTAYNIGRNNYFSKINLANSKNPYLDYNPKFIYSRSTDMEYINSELIPNLEIVEENNLESAYLISSDYKVEKIEIDKANKELSSHIKKINVSDVDLQIDNIEYRYKFLILKSFNEDYDIYLIGLKTQVEKNQEITFSPLIYSEEYILMLENYDKGNPEREGERQIAKQYKEIIKWYKNNLMN